MNTEERTTVKVLNDLAYYYKQQLRNDDDGMALSCSPTSAAKTKQDKSADAAEKMRSAKKLLNAYKKDAVKIGQHS